MFGFTEEEMDLYRDLAQDFAVTQVAPMVVGNAKFMTPLIKQGDEIVPNRAYINQLVTDIEHVITLITSHMAYEYAYLQSDSEMTEEEIIQHLHKKYETQVMQQFVKYGIVSSVDILSEIVGQVILELPYLYASVIEDDEFDDDEFLEERLAAYNQYLNDNFSNDDEEQEEEE